MTLTDRQRQVLEMRAEGMTTGQIARTLWLSEHTVKEHVKDAHRALGARSATQAVAIAFRRGILA